MEQLSKMFKKAAKIQLKIDLS